MNLRHVSHGSGAKRYICISKPLSDAKLPSSKVDADGMYSSM